MGWRELEQQAGAEIGLDIRTRKGRAQAEALAPPPIKETSGPQIDSTRPANRAPLVPSSSHSQRK